MNKTGNAAKAAFEPLDMKVVQVKVEKGYATSDNQPVEIQQWSQGYLPMPPNN